MATTGDIDYDFFRNRYPPEPLDTEFKRKYPPDKFGEEATDNARVWKVFRDEAIASDRSMLDGWNKTLDILLIFAGLFSAVSTALIVESYKLLHPDFTEYTANALYIAVSSWNGSAFEVGPTQLRAPADFSVNQTSRWINGLWFISLVLSLAVALLSILAKQWLEEYASRTSTSTKTPRDWVHRRMLFYGGVIGWGLPGFISALPALLHLSLFLFLAGLIVFLTTLDTTIAALTAGLAGVLLVFYSASVATPLWKPDCPSSIPLAHQMRSLWMALLRLGVRWALRRLSALQDCRWHLVRYTTRQASVRLQATAMPRQRTDTAPFIISKRADELDAVALRWLIVTSPVPNVVMVAVHAIGSFRPWSYTIKHLRLLECDALIEQHLLSHYSAERPPSLLEGWGVADTARLMRGVMILGRVDLPATVSSWDRSIMSEPEYDLALLSACSTSGQSFLSAARGRASSLQWQQLEQPNFPPFSMSSGILTTAPAHTSIPWFIHIFHIQWMHLLRPEELGPLSRRIYSAVTSRMPWLQDSQLANWPDPDPAILCAELFSYVVLVESVTGTDTDSYIDALHPIDRHIAMLNAVHSTHLAARRALGMHSVPHLVSLLATESFALHPWSLQQVADLVSCLAPGGDMQTIRRGRFGGLLDYRQALIHLMAQLAQLAADAADSGGLYDAPGKAAVRGVAVAVASTCGRPRYTSPPQGHPAQAFHTLTSEEREFLWPLYPLEDRASVWHMLCNFSSQLWEETEPWMNVIAPVAEVLAPQLCALRRRGVTTIESLIIDFLAEDFWLVFWMKAARQQNRFNALQFEHLARHCIELSSTWRSDLDAKAIVVKGVDEASPEFRTYVQHLDEKFRPWTPCPECADVA